ncbi:hypothetical protein TWF506_011386 [Arthrobotrys conoides]|uniref:Uncharacterized protein n=1 Tax=Arthrobotrys conoides TaxID=74498 RepID=A0AAN8RVK3_9PEZI
MDAFAVVALKSLDEVQAMRAEVRMKPSIPGDRKSQSFINTDQEPEGSHAQLDENGHPENPFELEDSFDSQNNPFEVVEEENPFEQENIDPEGSFEEGNVYGRENLYGQYNPYGLESIFEDEDLYRLEENLYRQENISRPESLFGQENVAESESLFEQENLFGQENFSRPESLFRQENFFTSESIFGQENPFQPVFGEEEEFSIPIVDDDGDYENWYVKEEPEEQQLPPQPDKKELDRLKKAEFIKAFRRWIKLQKHNRPNRKQTIKFILKARTGYKRLGRRYHSYTGIIGKNRQIKQKSHCVLFRNLPEEKEITKESKYYYEPVERENQGPRLRTKAAAEGHKKAAQEYAEYLAREVLNFRKGEYRAAKVQQVVEKQTQDLLKIELGLAHERGLEWGWYLCEGAEGTPWGNCAKFCDWPGCLGPEPSEAFYKKMEEANDNINPMDNLPIRFPFLGEVKGGKEKETTNRAPPGSGFHVGFDFNRSGARIHHIVQRAQDLIYDNKSTRAFDYCKSYLEDDCDELMIRPPITTLDKAHLAFTAGSAARFAYLDVWSVRRRISEIEKYMTLTVFHMLSDSKILKNNMNMHFYADVKAKVHYWGEIHQLHFLMPQRGLGDLMDVLSRERLKRLVRLHRNKMSFNKEELKKGYTLQVMSIPIREAAKPVISRRKHLIAKIMGRGEQYKAEHREKPKRPPRPPNIFQRLWNSLWVDKKLKPAGEGLPGIQNKRKNEGPDIIEMLELHERPEESEITWISKDGIGRRRKTPMPKFNYQETIQGDHANDYPHTIEFRHAALR